MMEEYDGMFWDCHAGNDYLGETVILSRSVASGRQAEQRRKDSIARSQAREATLAALHAAGDCARRCPVCELDRRP